MRNSQKIQQGRLSQTKATVIVMPLKRPLALLLLCAMLSACGESAPSGDTSAPTGDTTTPEEAEDSRLAEDDNLPAKNFGGYEFRVMYCSYGQNSAADPYAPETANGDIVNDAIYERNLHIEERFNINIVAIDNPVTAWRDHTQTINKNVFAGDDFADLTVEHCLGGPNNTLEGVYLNLHELEYVDFSKPWWSEQMVEEMTVRGQMYICGDVISLGMLQSAKVHYINKQKFEDYNLELPYQQVFDGTWTLDKLIALTRDVYNDVNGNSEADQEDFYGYISHCNQNGWLTSCNTPVLAKDDDGTLIISAYTEKTVNLVEKLTSFYYESTGTLIFEGKDPNTGEAETTLQARLFAEGHALVGFSWLSSAASDLFRSSTVEYGIIPFPKYDENQEDYITFASGNLMGVPVTNSDPERTGIILEAIAAETWKTVVPAYFSTALKEKFTFDSESGQALDIINDSLTISFAYCYDNWEGYGHMLENLFSQNSPTNDFASYYASKESSAKNRLQLINEYFEENEP